MRVRCPLCGERDRREFTYQGHAVALKRPEGGATAEAWDDYLHLRDNPAGPTKDLWYHDPCQAWVIVHRNTVTHEIAKTELASEAKR
jgi:sarcosine oxidase subunit delta